MRSTAARPAFTILPCREQVTAQPRRLPVKRKVADSKPPTFAANWLARWVTIASFESMSSARDGVHAETFLVLVANRNLLGT